MKPDHPLTTRSALLRQLKDVDDENAWREFTRTYTELIRRLALKACLSEDEAEEVVQEVLIGVARNIGQFTYDPAVCSFKRWLSNMVRWKIASQQRKRFHRGVFISDHESGSRGTDILERIPAPEHLEAMQFLDAEWGRRAVEAALWRVKKHCNAKHYQIYFLHVLKEKPITEVCRQLKVNRGQVYLAKMRIGRLVEKELTALAKEA